MSEPLTDVDIGKWQRVVSASRKHGHKRIVVLVDQFGCLLEELADFRELRIKIRCYEAFVKRLKTNVACPYTNMGKREYEIMFEELGKELE